MNYLAHLFLSGKEQEIIVGNLLEDFVVGRIDHPRNAHFPERIKIGILLHRQIDTFTDTHPYVSACKSVLYEKYGKYSAVVVDIFFDHFLAVNWHKFTDENLDNFTKRVYFSYENHWDILPEKMKPMISSMIKYDWLKNYSEFWAIEKALLNVSKRAIYQSNMENALEDLKLHYDFFQENFLQFFPEMMKVCNNFLRENIKE